MNTRLPPFSADILREVMNIGGAHAMTALSRLSHGKVMITVPKVSLLKLEEVMDFVGGTEQVMSMTIHPIVGDISGFILFSYAEGDASSLASYIQEIGGMKGHKENLPSTLQEIGNILSGSCLNAIYQFLGVRTTQTSP